MYIYKEIYLYICIYIYSYIYIFMFCSIICIHMYGCIDRFTHVCIYSELCACCANIDTDAWRIPTDVWRMCTCAGPHQRAVHDSGRTRACNLWFRRPTPYPLGHRAHSISCRDHDGQLREDSVGATDGWLDSSVLPGVGSIDHDPPRTRAWNLRLRRPMPYPLGQWAKW